VPERPIQRAEGLAHGVRVIRLAQAGDVFVHPGDRLVPGEPCILHQAAGQVERVPIALPNDGAREGVVQVEAWLVASAIARIA